VIALLATMAAEVFADPWDDWLDDVVVNAEGDTYDSRPSVAVSPNGNVWMAWHAYHMGRDRILARQLGPAAPVQVHKVSGGGTVHAEPVIVTDPDDSAWVFWAAKLASGRWQILGRQFVRDEWQPIVELSPRRTDAILPAAARISEDRLAVSWCAYGDARFRIWGRTLEAGRWQEPMAISDGEHDAFRSAIAVDTEKQTWIFWDTYRDRHYVVVGRPLLPELGPTERISPADKNCLTPTALGTASGLWVAWLQVDNVIGGHGAVSQWHTLHAAARTQEGWHVVVDGEGKSAGATLTHGLIARMEPTPVATGGYMGRRRHPMLLEDGDGVWLLWERKSDHRGRTPNATGELIGRRVEQYRWQGPVVLHRGFVDYHLAQAARTHGQKFLFVASDLPRKARRIYHLSLGDIEDAVDFHQDDWPGWEPVALPFPDDDVRRHEIRIGDKPYRLYWGDLHCHTGLTADAEGEPDELMHYARDRARLDVVVMTENDAIYDAYLTEAEFALDHFFAGAFSRSGKFLALPGYEWTSRLPRSPETNRSDPRNWDAQHSRGSFPDHRTVIYLPSGGPVVRHPEVENNIGSLNQAVERAGGVTLTQHATWVLTGHPVETGVEVTSGWGIYIRNPQRVHAALNDGYRISLVGCGDSHRRNPGLCGGLTAVYAPELTAEAILDALRKRRVYATSGSRIVLDSRANGTFMGEETRSRDGTVKIALKVIGTKPIEKATLIRDGAEVKTFEGGGKRDLSVAYNDTGLPSGTHWYYWRIAQQRTPPSYPGNVKVARGNLAWSTPHWVIVP
jgi:hypothetical protein